MACRVELLGATVRVAGRDILRGVDFRLEPGEHWALIGPNGSGKTTLLKLLRGDTWPMDPATRRYECDGQAGPNPIRFRQLSRLVTPEAVEVYRRREDTLSGLGAVLTGLSDGRYLYTAPTARQRAAALKLMARAGAAHLAELRLDHASEGQLKLLALLRALAAGPQVLLLDEITDGLDARSREAALACLERAVTDGVQLIMATHRAGDVPGAVTRVARLDAGRITRLGGRELLTALATPGASTAQSTPPAARDTAPLWEIAHADVRLDGVNILRDVNWTVRHGERWLLTGPNGAGKSTLVRLVMGEVAALGGPKSRVRIRRLGRTHPTLWEVRRRIGCVSLEQQAGYDASVTALETVVSGFFGHVGLHAEASPAQWSAARELMGRFAVDALADTPLERLSFGRRRLMLILRALVHNPEALVLDEPLSGLDTDARAEVLALVRELATTGVTLVMVSHRADDWPPEMDLELALDDGRVSYCGLRRN